MCRECHCEYEWQCSVKGFQPTGWCCERCDLYDPKVICENRFRILIDSEAMEGICLGCNQKRRLTWIYIETHQGFCRECLTKNDKKSLLEIAFKKCGQT
ncbi:MAG: hypothetical protein ACTSRS_09110 [Candidatus Helarchaeota archaeon]